MSGPTDFQLPPSSVPVDVCDWSHPELVIVWWDEAQHDLGWKDRGDLRSFAQDDACRTQSVGWLIWADDRCVVLVAEQVHYGQISRIPRAAITGYRHLERV